MYRAKLSSDTPVADPAGDAFGFAGFAKNLAKAIRTTPSPDGLVMAINGPWGAGKTSLLNLVKHDLKTIHEEQCPVIVDFNPWWFNGRDQLASQLLGAMATRIRSEHPGLLKIGELLAEYSSAISKTVALSTGHPWLDVPVNWFLKRLKRAPKDVPKLKAELAEMLRKGNVRVLVIVDDLDRLTPEEIRELFKVIKALADFPNVIYLLSFAKDIVAHALTTSLNVDGDAYMEKIVQAAFSLPAVDKSRLQRKLFEDLNTLVEALPMGAFDATYWGNVYYDGLHHFISTPRDIVRITNVLAVT
ncbi:MAG TPA: KAP family NTPase, partial [Roseateles sp.]